MFMPTYYEDEFDEILMAHNPTGGRPLKIGGIVWSDKEKVLDVTRVEENVIRRFMLGYCTCGKKIVIGYKRAEYLASLFKKQGIDVQSLREPIRLKLARSIVSSLR